MNSRGREDERDAVLFFCDDTVPAMGRSMEGNMVRPLHIFTWVTRLAAAGLVVVTLSAATYHTRRQEFVMVPVTVVLAVLAGFVAYARFVASPL